jgi:subtilisin family serine protease
MPNRGHAQVKLAILDTGIDVKHNFIDGAIMDKRIQARKSFVDNEDVQDLCGHGTHMAGLALKAAPEALIYIAKIARDMEVQRGHRIAEVKIVILPS